MDPREDIALAFDEPGSRRTSVTPPPLRRLAQVPDTASPRDAEPAGLANAGEAEAEPVGAELPGRRRSCLQYLELYVTGRAYELLTAQRSVGSTMGQATIEALRHSRQWLLDTYAPEPAGDEDDFFPAPRRSHRRFHVDGGRHVSAGVSPEEAAAVGRLAADVDLTLSELVSVAVEHHFGDDDR